MSNYFPLHDSIHIIIPKFGLIWPNLEMVATTLILQKRNGIEMVASIHTGTVSLNYQRNRVPSARSALIQLHPCTFLQFLELADITVSHR